MNDMLKEYGSETQFKYALSLQGRTIEQYREQMKYDIVVNKMAADIVRDKKKDVTKEEARRYYDDHPEEMTGAEVRHLQHVMIKVDRYAPEAVVKKARKKLEQVAADPNKFAEIVEKGSESGEEIKGVDAGFVARGSIHPLLDSVAGRLEAGKISRVIKTEEGFHLLLVKKILPADVPRPYEDIESDLIHKLYEQRSVAILDAEIEKLRAKADIVIMDKMAANKREQENSLSE